MSETRSRFIIGIDLGTTNSTLAYVDTTVAEPETQTLLIPQIIAPGEVASSPTLPSFLYLADSATVRPGSLNLPWSENECDYAAGVYARSQGSTTPGKVISSAKSWLCCETIDRTAQNLPVTSQNERKLSSVETMTAYLQHLAQAWDHQMAEGDSSFSIVNQEVILTVPASFDAVARELTVKAADNAGLRVTLLEEPQAAFYSWLREHQETWRDHVEAGNTILVCDIGGGTTDFSLIGVDDESGDLALTRIAVGNHILLGGDNMDITLAYHMQQKLNKKLTAKQMAGLIHACRQAKENLLENRDLATEKITILGSGSSLIGGTLSTELTRDEISEYLLNGFTPESELSDTPQKEKRSGLRSFGLNYETDTALTRHLANFVRSHSTTESGANSGLPNVVLFNGGVTKAAVIRDKITSILSRWSGQDVSVLTGTDPDLAVARGAAWYGYVKRGNAVRIKSGSAFSYYLGVESSMPAIPGFEAPMEALCVIPFGTEDGTELQVPAEHLGLIVGESTEFRFFASNSRPEDAAGAVISDFHMDTLKELPALSADLPDETGKAGSVLPVILRTIITEIGTLQVWCSEKNGDRKWKLEFNLKSDEEVSPQPVQEEVSV